MKPTRWCLAILLCLAPGLAAAIPTVQITGGGAGAVVDFLDICWNLSGTQGFGTEGCSVIGFPPWFERPTTTDEYPLHFYSSHFQGHDVETDCVNGPEGCDGESFLRFTHPYLCGEASNACLQNPAPWEITVPFIMPMNLFTAFDIKTGDPVFSVNLFGRGLFTVTHDGAGEIRYAYVFTGVPEPSTLGLLGVGLVSVVWLARKRWA